MVAGTHGFQPHNPLCEEDTPPNQAAPCVVVIFGASGDLTRRRLVPGLYNLAREGHLPAHFCCVGFARRDKDHGIFRSEMLEGVREYSRSQPVDANLWSSFQEQLLYHRSNFDDDEGYVRLGRLLKQLDSQFGTQGNRVYYLSTQPQYFPVIIERLRRHGLIYDAGSETDPWSRVIIEKPFGHDLASALELQSHIGHHLHESQTYRIDHWLGKETVQNLLIFRFANPIFEAVWNNHFVDHVQITVAEDIGIGSRGNLFENQGILRDIVQNHVMQLLALIAMEPPGNLSAEAIRDEKVKVIESIAPLSTEDLDRRVIRGQYGPGYVQGESVLGYRQEGDVSEESAVETYAAMKLYIDNWRWAGVPFYLRAGKRMPKRVTEIAITFKAPPGHLYDCGLLNNVLAIRIQPDENIALKINCKVPGQRAVIHPVKMDFRYNASFGGSQQEAYERLLWDCMAGDSTLFARIDEVLSSWRLLSPILDHWKSKKPDSWPNYAAGKWGPEEADAMMFDGGRRWRIL